MGTYYRIVNFTRKEAFEGQDGRIKRGAISVNAGPALMLLLIDGYWSNGDDIRVCADNASDGYERSLDWPEPAGLKEVWGELDMWRQGRDDEIALLDAEISHLRVENEKLKDRLLRGGP